jgi:hypothetical protein
MNRDSFAYGVIIGIPVALPLSIATTATLKRLPEGNLVNFGPGLFGFCVFALEFVAAAAAVIAAGVFLFRKRRRPAGFLLSFALTVLGWWARVLFYTH